MPDPFLLPFAPPGGPPAVPRPGPDPLASLVEKERTIQILQGEVAAWKYLLGCAQKEKELALGEAAGREAVEQALRAELAARERVEQALRAELAAIAASDGWRFVQLLRQWRLAVAPPASRREWVFALGKRALKLWRRRGLLGLAARTIRKIRGKGLRASLQLAGLLVSPWGKPGGKGSEPPEEKAARGIQGGGGTCTPPPPDAPGAGRSEPAVPPAGREAATLSVNQVRTIEALDEILCLPPRDAHALDKPIDVILPVFRGLDETLACLRRLLTAPTATAYEVVVVGGAAGDPLLVRCLHEIAAAGLVTLLDDPAAGSAEMLRRALALHAGRDVVLLDAAAAVYGDWVDRLRATAYATREAGTVSPLTNAATPAGYPFIARDGPAAPAYRLPDDLPPERLDRLCATVNRGLYADLPLGTGPCLYVRRDCLTAVGPPDGFDVGTFCRQARDRGWRHLAAVDTFVSQTPGDVPEMTHNPFGLPPEDPLMVSHRLANPALAFRRQIDLARLAGPEPAMLYVTHNRGGGIERHIGDMAARLEGEGVRVVVLRPVGGDAVRLERLGDATLPNLVFTLPGEYWTLRDALQTLGVGHVHIHHAIDLPDAVFDLIGDLALPYDWTVHDYYAVCPLVHLLDERGIYCGEPCAARCNVCLEKNQPADADPVEITAWREEHRSRLAGARRVFVPSEDVAARLSRYFPGVALTVRPHFETRVPPRPVAVPWTPGEPLRVALIGHLTLHKGAAVLADCARDALARRLPLRFCVAGYTDRDDLLRGLANVSITGPYREDAIFPLLESLRCHCAFFPSVCPETFSYTLSIALLGGLFPVAFDLGAPAGRLRASGTGHLIALTTDAALINDELLSLTDLLTQPPADPPDGFGLYQTLLVDYYGLPRVEAAAAA